MSKPKLIPVPSSKADVALLLHGAVIHGYTADDYRLVVGRHRPFIPHGTDPADVNRECERRYAVCYETDGHSVREVHPKDVVPFLDLEALRLAADIRANAAQATNKREDES